MLFKNEYQKAVNKDSVKILREEERKRLLNLPSNTEINIKIHINELNLAIRNAQRNKTYGPDEIHYEFYKYTPEQIIEKILNQINQCWNKGEYHKEFKNVIINPINKPCKNRAEAVSFRYISRISALGKIFENIITET